MSEYYSVFRNEIGRRQVIEAYNEIMSYWPVPYEDLYINTCLGSTHIIASGAKDAQPIILNHAYYASAAAWFKNVGALSEKYRVYAIDMIGDPNKSQPYKPIRQSLSYIDRFNDLLEGLQLSSADFIGNSVGAYHIVNYAANAPKKVKRMILIGPAATFLKITQFYINTFSGGITGWPFLVNHAINWIENGAPLDPKFKKLFFLTMRYGRTANQVFPAVFNDIQLKRLNTPTLLIYGENEVIYDIDNAVRRALKFQPDTRIEIIPGGNHLTALSQPELVNHIVLEFLDNKKDNANKPVQGTE